MTDTQTQEKGYTENHVRFLDQDGQPLVTLCLKGDGDEVLLWLREQLNRAYTAEPRPKDIGYAVPKVLATLTQGHLIRPEVPDTTVENVFFVSEQTNDEDDANALAAPYISAYSTVTGEFFFGAYA